MSEISEKIRYVLQFYYEKKKKRPKPGKKFVMFTVKMLYQMQQHVDGLLVSVLEISV